MSPKHYPRRIITDDDSFIMSPKNDFAFRLLFGDERFDDLLISLLSAILGQHIEQVTIKNPYLLPAFYKDKEGILDVKAYPLQKSC